MEATEVIGKVSGLLVLLSILPYAWRVWQGNIKPNIVGWSLWSCIGLSILLNYKNIGAGDNIWPAIFGFTNPFIISLLAIWKRKKNELPGFEEKKEKWETMLEIFCVLFCFLSIILWWHWLDDPAYSEYGLFTAMTADACAAIPTMVSVWRKPSSDRPLMWLLFAIGYSLSILAIKEHNLANYSLPVYMFIGSVIVSIPLISWRIKNKIKIKHWM